MFKVYFLGLVLFLLGCASPPDWQGNPYILPDGRPGQGKLARDQSVRVLVLKTKTPVRFDNSVSIHCSEKKVSQGFQQKPGCFHKGTQGYIQLKGKKYPGSIYIYREQGMIFYVNHVPIDYYIASVLSYEMNPLWPKEALKAQAVAARTYFMNKVSYKPQSQYDIGNSTKHQVYGGYKKHINKALAASRATAGQVLVYDGKLADVFFHSSCGGISAAASEVWKNDLAYLRSKAQPYCDRSPAYSWQVSFSAGQLGAKLGLRNVQGVRILERSISRRVKLVEVRHSAGTTQYPANLFRQKLGNTALKSTLFRISGSREAIVFKGRGYGHGVGLCQWGARYLATGYNRKYSEILSTYFPGTNLSRKRS